MTALFFVSWLNCIAVTLVMF